MGIPLSEGSRQKCRFVFSLLKPKHVTGPRLKEDVQQGLGVNHRQSFFILKLRPRWEFPSLKAPVKNVDLYSLC